MGANISVLIDTNNSRYVGTTSQNKVGIRCDSDDACNAGNGGSIVAMNANIYVTALLATGSTAITIATGNDSNKYNGTTEYDIICTGGNSCDSNYIKNGNNLYCNGYESCENSLLISHFNSIYGYGSNAIEYSIIKYINNIYCGGYQSCQLTRITNVFNNIYASNYQVLYQSIINHVENCIIGAGYQALYQSTISNVSNVYCISTRSCEDSTIRDVHDSIYANGENALRNSEIISSTVIHSNNSNTLYIYINGTNDGYFDIQCTARDICYIECQSSQACTNLKLYCGDSIAESRCFVACGDSNNGVDCPFLGKYHQWILIPTNIPSVYPSSINFNYNITTFNSTNTAENSNTTITAENLNTTITTENSNTTIATINSSTIVSSGDVVNISTTITTFNSTNTAENSNATITAENLNTTNTAENPNTTIATSSTIVSSGDVVNISTTITDNGISLDSQTFIIVLVSVGSITLLLVTCMCLLFIYCHKRLKSQKSLKSNVNITEIINNKKKHRDNNNNNKLAMYNKDGQIIDLRRIQSLSTTPKSGIDIFTTKSNADSNKNNNINQENDIDDNEDDTKSDHEDMYNYNYDDDEEHIHQTEGATKRALATNNSDGVVGEVDDMYELHMVGVTSSVTMEGEFEQWTQEQVSQWIKSILIKNDIENSIINLFLAEFNEKNIDGKMLKQFRNDKKFLDKSIAQFSSKNQIFSIWSAIKTSIDKIE